MDTTYTARAALDEWMSPSGPDTELTEAGVWWDALRAPSYLGDQVLARLGDECGTVIRDPYAQHLYWLIPPGTAGSWVFPGIAHVQVLGTASWVAVPPGDRVRPPGLHWAKPVNEGSLLTEPDLLHDALSAVIADALGPRRAVNQ